MISRIGLKILSQELAEGFLVESGEAFLQNGEEKMKNEKLKNEKWGTFDKWGLSPNALIKITNFSADLQVRSSLLVGQKEHLFFYRPLTK